MCVHIFTFHNCEHDKVFYSQIFNSPAILTCLCFRRHTTCAVYACGALLFILIPGLLRGLRGTMDSAAAGTAVNGIGSSDADNTVSGPPTLHSFVLSTELVFEAAVIVLTPVKQYSVPLWVSGGVLTAIGRVLARAHWVSDTMAGACLGAGLLALACMIDQLCTKSSDLEQEE